MNFNPTISKHTCRTQSTEKQAIKDSLAPFAPFPGAIRQSDDSVSRHIKSKTAK